MSRRDLCTHGDVLQESQASPARGDSIYFVPMRRWLVTLLVLLLPIQFTWVVAAPYCKHETSVQVPHFGHHSHQHKDADAASPEPSKANGKADGGSQEAVDYDCELCHLTTANLEPGPTPTVARGIGSTTHYAWEHLWSSRDPDRLDRPNWRLA